MVILATLFRCWSTLWNSALKITMLFWCSLRLLVNINVEIDDVDSTMFNVTSFKVDIHLVVSTLIWLCPTLRCHINLTTTLKQRCNFCWDTFFYKTRTTWKNVGIFSDQSSDASTLCYILYQIQKQLYTGIL